MCGRMQPLQFRTLYSPAKIISRVALHGKHVHSRRNRKPKIRRDCQEKHQKNMNNDITLKYPFFQKALNKIQSIHPEWAIRIESVYKAFYVILPPTGYFDDFVPQALIRSQNKEWRAWLVPSTVKDIDDYIPLEYQNVIHVHAPLELSKPLDELLSTNAGIKEFVRKSNRDICHTSEQKCGTINKLFSIMLRHFL